MSGEQDRYQTIVILIASFVLVCLAIAFSYWMVPSIVSFVEIHFQGGLDLKQSAIYAFILTLVFMIIIALFSGDGLIGEIQFVLPAFIGFYLIIWLQLAWIF